MHINQEVAVHPCLTSHTIERRNKPRIYAPFPATVQGVDTGGKEFQSETILDNISTGGLYMRLMSCLERGADLYIVVQMSAALTDDPPCVAIQGIVSRVETMPGGTCGIAVAFRHHHFAYE